MGAHRCHALTTPWKRSPRPSGGDAATASRPRTTGTSHTPLCTAHSTPPTAVEKKVRIMKARSEAGARVTHDVRMQRNHAQALLHEIRTVLDRYDEQRHSGLWIDIDDVLGESIE